MRELQIAFDKKISHVANTIILGSWFQTSQFGGAFYQGYHQTMLTRYAPSILEKIKKFDQESEEYLRKIGWNTENSRSMAIIELRKIINNLENNLD